MCLTIVSGRHAAAATERDVVVDVVTFNAWGLPEPLAKGRRHRLPRARQWLERLDADLVALQEVWDGALPWWGSPVLRSGRDGDDGLGLVAKGTLERVEVLRFDAARSFDALKKKGAMGTWWRIPDGPRVRVAVTHLQSGWGEANGAVRASQVQQIVDWLTPIEAPVILLGDFNIDERHPEDTAVMETLADHGFVDVAAWLGHDSGTYPDDGRRYDRIYVRAGRRWRVRAEAVHTVAYDEDPQTPAPSMLSDHLPVTTRLRFVRRR